MVNENPAPPFPRAAQLEIVQVLDRMMAKDPGARYQTPEQLVQALDKLYPDSEPPQQS